MDRDTHHKHLTIILGNYLNPDCQSVLFQYAGSSETFGPFLEQTLDLLILQFNPHYSSKHLEEYRKITDLATIEIDSNIESELEEHLPQYVRAIYTNNKYTKTTYKELEERDVFTAKLDFNIDWQLTFSGESGELKLKNTFCKDTNIRYFLNELNSDPRRAINILFDYDMEYSECPIWIEELIQSYTYDKQADKLTVYIRYTIEL